MFKMHYQKNTTHNIRHEKRAIKNETDKNQKKKMEQHIVQGVKITLIILNHKKNEMKNKVLREKLNCLVCWSSKSRFLKQKHNNNNKKFSDNINCEIVFSNYKNMHMYCKNCEKHTGNTFPKKLVLISKNKIKGKSKCAICLTKRTFIHEIEGKYGI